MGLNSINALDQGNQVLLLTWLGDSANEALAWLLASRGITAQAAGPGVEVTKRGKSVDQVRAAVLALSCNEVPPLDVLLPNVDRLQREKWDWALPDGLLRKGFVANNLEITDAVAWATLQT